MLPMLRTVARMALVATLVASPALSQNTPAGRSTQESAPGRQGAPYADIPEFAPIGTRLDKYMDIPADAKGPPVDPAKGYRLEKLGDGLWLVTDNLYQSMFMVYDKGVVVVDAPPTYAAKLKAAIAEVTDKPITHLIYSHSHADHIAGSAGLGPIPIIIAQEETKRLLIRDADPRRPIPTVTFKDTYTLKLGDQVLELSYHGNGHEPGNIYVYAPKQKTLMFIDMVFPGWMPYRRFAVAQDIPGYFEQVAALDKLPFEKIVTGHVQRIGTHADVKLQIEFNNDIKAAALAALQSTTSGDGLKPIDKANQWAVVSDYTARAAAKCVIAMTPKWKTKLAAFDVFIWDNCYSMQQSLYID